MKKTLLFTICVFISIACFSQDIISLKKGNRLEVIVTEITPTLVRYRLYKDSSSRVYFVYKNDVSNILYQNGTIEKFGDSEVQTPVSIYDNAQDVIIMKNNDEIRGRVLEIGVTEIRYKRGNDEASPTYSLRKSDIYMIRYANGSVEKYDSPQRPILSNNYHVKNASNFSQFHFGLAFPSGKFGDGNTKYDDWMNGRGFAATGFTLGFKHYSSFSVENLYWVLGIQAFYNDVNSDLKDEFEEDGDYSDITFPKYLNFPATLGLHYSIPLSETVKLYGEAAAGVNFSMPTKFLTSGDYYYGSYYEEELKFTPAFGFTYGVEGGFFFNQKYSLSVRYNNLGSYKYKYETEERYNNHTETDKGKIKKALPITNISLCFGFLF